MLKELFRIFKAVLASPTKPEQIRIFRNFKTGGKYIFVDFITDCTNSRDGEVAVLYFPIDQPKQLCVREKVEFFQKFEEIYVK